MKTLSFLFVSASFGALLVANSGCQLAVDFNRSLIDGGEDGSFSDASEAGGDVLVLSLPDAPSDVVVDGEAGGSVDGGATDAAHDATTADGGGDATVHDSGSDTGSAEAAADTGDDATEDAGTDGEGTDAKGADAAKDAKSDEDAAMDAGAADAKPKSDAGGDAAPDAK